MTINYLPDQFSLHTVSGEKAREFLQGQLTCDMNKVDAMPQLAAYCDPKGRVLASLFVWQAESVDVDPGSRLSSPHTSTDLAGKHEIFMLALDTSLSDSISKRLNKYAQFSRVTISHAEDQAVDPGYFAAQNSGTQPADFLIRNLSKNTIEPHITTENSPAKTIAWITDKTSGLFTPQMLDYEKLGAVSFTKGCYVGQEIIARTQHLGKLKRHLHRISAEVVLLPGDELSDAHGTVLGVVVNCKHQHGVAVIQDQASSNLFTADGASVLVS